MHKYSTSSLEKLDSCDLRLQRIFTEVLQQMDHSIICGYRSDSDQHVLFLDKKTKVRKGKHQSTPSLAVDAIPYPINPDWNKDLEKICLFAGRVLAVAFKRGINLRWGRDWDQDNDLSDQTFNDYVHFEIVGD